MFKALVLVRNLKAGAEGLDFGEFTINPVGLRFKDLREILSSVDVNQDDWILEKSYTQLPLGPPGSPVGGIPNDVEDILILFRLYKPGDISFIKQAIILPSGAPNVQFPYRAMNDLNSYCLPRFQFKVDSAECQSWRTFADSIRESQSWSSDWFSAARRFFLSGGAKPFKSGKGRCGSDGGLRHSVGSYVGAGKGLQRPPHNSSRGCTHRARDAVQTDAILSGDFTRFVPG